MLIYEEHQHVKHVVSWCPIACETAEVSAGLARSQLISNYACFWRWLTRALTVDRSCARGARPGRRARRRGRRRGSERAI
jgi:hypothetical protein